MKKSFLVALTLFIILDMIFVLGWFGVSGRVLLKGGTCEASYPRYIIKPFLKNFVQCSYRKPCGTPSQDMLVYNAQAELFTCLCQKKENNQALISQLYNQEFHPNLPSTKTVDFICTEATKKVYAE